MKGERYGKNERNWAKHKPTRDTSYIASGEECDCCGKDYEDVYRVPDHIWFKVYGELGVGLLCMNCFSAQAKLLGLSMFWEGDDGEYPSIKGGMSR